MKDSEAFALINQMIGMLHTNYRNKKRDIQFDALGNWTRKLVRERGKRSKIQALQEKPTQSTKSEKDAKLQK